MEELQREPWCVLLVADSVRGTFNLDLFLWYSFISMFPSYIPVIMSGPSIPPPNATVTYLALPKITNHLGVQSPTNVRTYLYADGWTPPN